MREIQFSFPGCFVCTRFFIRGPETGARSVTSGIFRKKKLEGMKPLLLSMLATSLEQFMQQYFSRYLLILQKNNKCRIMFSVKKFWISVKKKMKKLFFTALRDGGAHVTRKNMSLSLLPWEKVGDAAVSEVLLWDRVSRVLDQEFGRLKETHWWTREISPMVDAVWGIAKLVAYLQFVPANSNAVKYHIAARNWLLHLLETFKEIWTTFEENLQDPYGQFGVWKSMLLPEIAVLHICNLLILNKDKNAAETLEFKTFFENRCQELVEDDDLVVGDPMHSRAGYIAVVQSILKVISTSCTTLVHRSKLDYVQKLVEQWLCDYKHVEQWCSELRNECSMSQAQTSMDELQVMCSHAHGVIIAIEMRRTM